MSTNCQYSIEGGKVGTHSTGYGSVPANDSKSVSSSRIFEPSCSPGEAKLVLILPWEEPRQSRRNGTVQDEVTRRELDNPVGPVSSQHRRLPPHTSVPLLFPLTANHSPPAEPQTHPQRSQETPSHPPHPRPSPSPSTQPHRTNPHSTPPSPHPPRTPLT